MHHTLLHVLSLMPYSRLFWSRPPFLLARSTRDASSVVWCSPLRLRTLLGLSDAPVSCTPHVLPITLSLLAPSVRLPHTLAHRTTCSLSTPSPHSHSPSESSSAFLFAAYVARSVNQFLSRASSTTFTAYFDFGKFTFMSRFILLLKVTRFL